jgi:D-beta-D-heptose 7-phosphate kinase/D-beta-D-heptose 1-phosphate adenosyltransferase
MSQVVLVLGDIMLDVYSSGRARRLSPEVAVPVFEPTASTLQLGGAANVAAHLVKWGADVTLVGRLGDDATADEVRARCGDLGITLRTWRQVGVRTTRKERLLAADHQLVRIDHEDVVDADNIGEALARAEIEQFCSRSGPRVLVVSDYAKGVVSDRLVGDAILRANHAGVPVVVDPKPGPNLKYRGADVIKPNRLETELILGRELPTCLDRDSLRAAAEEVCAATGAARAVISLGADGAYVSAGDDGDAWLPAWQIDVVSVSGAGDTLLAVIAHGLLSGRGLVEATAKALEAASIGCAHPGTSVIGPVDLDLFAERAGGHPGTAVVSLEGLVTRVQHRRDLGCGPVVFTNGCFDLLHTGHAHLLRQARALGGLLVVAVNSDGSVKRLKGESRPIVSATDRAALIAELQVVDLVTVFEDDTPLSVIEALRPEVIVKGGDYREVDVVGWKEAQTWGGRVVIVPLLDDRSTTAVVERVASIGEAPA